MGLLIAVMLISGCYGTQTATQPATQPVTTPTATQTASGQVREFDITAKRWQFSPSTITVNEGDKVKLNIRSLDVTHGFAIFEFGVNERLSPGRTVTVEFTADKAGEYTFACSVPCGSGHGGMNGRLIVE